MMMMMISFPSRRSSSTKTTGVVSGFLLFVVFLLLHATTEVEAAAASDESSSLPLSFGHSLLGKEFLLNYTNFNHGSYGACPKTVLEYQSSLRLQQEQQPDVWMRQHYKVLLNETRRKVGQYLQMSASEAETLVIVESASTAINSILRSYNWKNGDIVLMFSMAFKMVKYTADWLNDLYGIQIIYMPISFPITTTSVFIDALKTTLTNLTKTTGRQINNLKMIVLDQMVSVPAIKEPIAELAALVKQYQPECFVLVDGAHAMGQIPYVGGKEDGGTSLYSNIDAYLTNGHKWLYSPKGSAVLWINASRVTPTFPEPTVISSLNNINIDAVGIPLSERYSYVSARDYTAFLSLGAAIDFRQQKLGGEQRIYNYIRNLALEAKQYLMKLWNTTTSTGTTNTPLVPDSMEEFMIHVQLPIPCINTIPKGLALQDWLLEKHNTYIRNIYDEGSGIFYTRLSSQIYLEIQDFHTLGQHVLEFCNQLSSCEQQAAKDNKEEDGDCLSVSFK